MSLPNDDRTSMLEKLDQAIIEHAADAEELLVDLVAVPSVNPLQPGVAEGRYVGGESRANELLCEWLRNVGMETHVVEVEPGRANLVGIRRGAGGGVLSASTRTSTPWHRSRAASRTPGRQNASVISSTVSARRT